MQFLKSFLALAVTCISCSGVLAQSGEIFQPPEAQRRLGLPDKASPSGPVAPLPPTRPEPQSSAPAVPAARQQSPASSSGKKLEQAQASGTWGSECVDSTSGKETCQAVVRSTIGGQTALVLSIARSGNEVRMQMALPLGFDVQRAVEVKIGTFAGFMKVSRCTAQGCLIEETVPPGLLDALRTEPSGMVRMYTVDGKPIDIALPAAGAKATFETIALQ